MLRLAPIALLAVTIFGAAASLSMSQFGSRISPNPRFRSPYLTADLDGDGIADRIYLVSVAAGDKGMAPDVTVVSNLWSSQPLGAHSEALAIAIVLGKNRRKFLITGYQGEGVSDFFASPIWGEKAVPLSVANAGSKTARDFEHENKSIKHDILVVGTEAGIDTALYWNGTTFAVFEPEEEP